MPVNTAITFRKGSSSQWNSTNPVLASGEPGYDITNNILKIGDGVSNWNNLKNVASISGLITASSGNFNSLSVSGIAVSVSGHSHGNITSDGKIGSIASRIITTSNSGLLVAETDVQFDCAAIFIGISGDYINNGGMILAPGAIVFSDNTVQETAYTGKIGSTSGLLVVTTTDGSLTSSSGINSSLISNFNSSVSGLVSGIYQPLLTNPVTGVGTSGYLSRWNGTNSVTSGIIFDNGSRIGIGTLAPSGLLDVAGDVYIRGTGNNLGTAYFKSSSGSDTSHKIRVDTNGNLYLDAGSFFRAGSQDGAAEIQATSTFVRIGHGYNANSINQNIQFRPANTERMRITSDGNVGIGTTTPSGQLHVVGTGIVSSRLGIGNTNPQYSLDVSGSGNFLNGLAISGVPIGEVIDDEVAGLLVAGSGISLNYNDSANTLTVDSNVSTSLVAGTGISLTYNVTTDELSINTSSVYAPINSPTFSGTSSFANATFASSTVPVVSITSTSSTEAAILQIKGRTSDGAGFLYFTNNAGSSNNGFLTGFNGTLQIYGGSYTGPLTVAADGSLTSQPTYDQTAAGSNVVVTSAGLVRRTSSSIKYKKDIEDLDINLTNNAIDNLRPVWYRSKNPTGDDKVEWSQIGLIAEEAALVEPRIVRYKTVQVVEENGQRTEIPLETPEPEDIDYGRLAVLLLAEIKNLKSRIIQLESQINNS